jgi:hypothetical protein
MDCNISHKALLDEYEEYLQQKNIPSYKNVDIKPYMRITAKGKNIRYGDTICSVNFILPKTIVILRSGQSGFGKDGRIRDKLHESIDKHLDNIPKDYDLYVCCPNIGEVNYIPNCDRIKIVRDFSEIKYNEGFPYYIVDTSILRSIVAETNPAYQSDLAKYRDKKIYINKNSYGRSIAILNETEMKRIDELNIEFMRDGEDPPKNHILITYASKSSEKLLNHDFFSVFTEIIKPYSLTDSSIKMCIDGITSKCIGCKKILFSELLSNNTCRFCIGYPKI